jgi:hypothetical protein
LSERKNRNRLPDEHIYQWCKRYKDCAERKRVEAEGDIVIECECFEEVDV